MGIAFIKIGICGMIMFCLFSWAVHSLPNPSKTTWEFVFLLIMALVGCGATTVLLALAL